MRKGLPRKMAKVDSHQEAHPLIAGFPIEHALRHLANDPNNHETIRDLAMIALTGKGKLDKVATPEGKPEALWALHDALRDHGHPMEAHYNWMNAADKVQLDAKVYRALKERAGDIQRIVHSTTRGISGPMHWDTTPEGIAQGIKQRRNDRNLDYVKDRMKVLAPEASDKDIKESLQRHALRANNIWHQRQGLKASMKAHAERAKQAYQPDENNAYDQEEKASRYLRYKSLRSRYKRGVRRYAEGFEPVKPDKSGFHPDPNFNRTLVHYSPVTKGHHVRIFRPQWHGVTPTWKWMQHGKTLGPYKSLRDVRKEFPHSVPYISGGPGNPLGMELTDQEKELAGINPPREEPQDRPTETIPEDFYAMERGKRGKKYALQHRGDFIDSLRRIRSSNQKTLHKIADEVSRNLGLFPTKVMDALHDTPRGSTPGITQAIYGEASPEQIHGAAAWYGLTGNTPGVAVFHARDGGSDRLYRFHQDGSGLDIRTKLDRLGLRNRVMIPQKQGFDILIPDKGSVLGNNVKEYSRIHGLNLESSPGYFKEIGSQDQARARDMFRNTVARQESGNQRMRRGKRKYALPKKPSDTPPTPPRSLADLRKALTGLSKPSKPREETKPPEEYHEPPYEKSTMAPPEEFLEPAYTPVGRVDPQVMNESAARRHINASQNYANHTELIHQLGQVEGFPPEIMQQALRKAKDEAMKHLNTANQVSKLYKPTGLKAIGSYKPDMQMVASLLRNYLKMEKGGG